jgi:hypothetical protein
MIYAIIRIEQDTYMHGGQQSADVPLFLVVGGP